MTFRYVRGTIRNLLLWITNSLFKKQWLKALINFDSLDKNIWTNHSAKSNPKTLSSNQILSEMCIRNIRPREGGRWVSTLSRIFKVKICYKYIPLCSFVCFELSFKAYESLKLVIFACWALFLAELSLMFWYKFVSNDLSATWTPSVRKMTLGPWHFFHQLRDSDFSKILDA